MIDFEGKTTSDSRLETRRAQISSQARRKLTDAALFLSVLIAFQTHPTKLSAQLPSQETTPAATNTACYRIVSTETPFANQSEHPSEKIWCWRDLPDRGAKLVYRVDEAGETLPELSFVVERDGSITHVSLVQGRRTFHRVSGNYNPFPVPITPPESAERVLLPQSIGTTSVASSNGALEILTAQAPDFAEITIRASGTSSANVPAENLPWRGFWWPHSSGKLHRGEKSPTAKFDQFVRARTGSPSGARAWERRNHEYTGISWAGHCNGWAAAAILRPEPKEAITDPLTGITFTASDMKGLLSERDYCPEYLFFGTRYRGRARDNRADIRPVDFHNTIAYYLGVLKKPVLMDIKSDAPVENRVVSAYEMNVSQRGANSFRIATTLTIHTYDTKVTEEPGTAPSFTRTYTYDIQTDAEGHPVKGSWVSANPDFFWVPLAPGSCSDANPFVTERWIQAIGRPANLPRW